MEGGLRNSLRLLYNPADDSCGARTAGRTLRNSLRLLYNPAELVRDGGA